MFVNNSEVTVYLYIWGPGTYSQLIFRCTLILESFLGYTNSFIQYALFYTKVNSYQSCTIYVSPTTLNLEVIRVFL